MAVIETAGSTRLDLDDSNRYLIASSHFLTYGGAMVTAGAFGDWVPVGAEQVNGGYQIVWTNSTSGLFVVWTTDGSGGFQSQTGLMTAAQMEPLEPGFGQDFNGGGVAARTVIESSGATTLATVAGTYILSPSGGSPGPQLKMGGVAVALDQFGAWSPLAVELSGGLYRLAWQNGGTDQYIAWNVDADGNFVSQGAVVGGGSWYVQSYETVVGRDLNGDGTLGPVATAIDGGGNTTLTRVADSYFFNYGSSSIQLRYGGNYVAAGQFGAWTPLAVELSGGLYRLAWKNGGADQYLAWNVDADGNFVSQGTVVGGSTWYVQSYETVVGRDLNGDGTLGPVATAIDGGGNTTLTRVADSYFFNYGPSSVQLRYGGNYVAAGQFGAWTPLAVELSGGLYRLAWKNGGADQYLAWNVDADGNFVSQGTVVGGSTWWVQSYEPVVQYDLNADGRIGLALTFIETVGVSSLAKVADSYFINYGSTNIQVAFGGAYAAEGQFGTWTPIGAEQTVGGYVVAWKNGAADQYVVWSTDAGGNYVWQNAGTMSGSSPVIQALEVAFQQDLSSGGPVASRVTIESAGSTALTNVGGYLLLDAAGSLSGPLLAYGDQFVTSLQFGVAMAAEWTGNGYMVAWSTGTDSFNFWTSDPTGRYVSQTGNLAGVSAQMQAYEPLFAQDLNGDGVIGVNLTPFNIQVVYTGNSAYQSYFTQAAHRWESIIRADLPGMTHSTYGFIDDLRIDATVRAIDGVNGILGQAGPSASALRPGTSLPYHGIMEFDSADLAGMASNGTLLNVILHEMGHVLGLGTLWSYKGLSSGSSYFGTNALNAYRQVGGTGTVVPLETTGGSGTRFVHWSESVFDNELMTGFVEAGGVSMPLSVVTIGSLQDLGYTVDYGQADGYRLPGRLTSDAEIVADASGSGTVSETPPSTAIDTAGASSLLQDEDHYFLDAAGDDWVPPLSYAGVAVTTGQFGDWTPVGAEQTASGFQVAWKMAGEDQYVVWQTDSAGQWLSQTAALSGGSLALQSREAGFQQDLNGDGVIGVHVIGIESQGSTTLSHAADGYVMRAAGGMSDGVVLKYLGMAVTEDQFGGWKAIAAEETATGFDVAWKMDGEDQYILWHTDAQGNWLGQTVPVSGSDAALLTSESTFAQDLNDDGTLGLAASALVAAASDDAEPGIGAEITVDLYYSTQPEWMLNG